MHKRKGSSVKGHFRNGSWVSPHSRSGTTVQDSASSYFGATTDSYLRNVPTNIWSSFNRTSSCGNSICPKCRRSVFFIRHNGGCVWLDDLGWPWPKHACFAYESPSWFEFIRHHAITNGSRANGAEYTQTLLGTVDIVLPLGEDENGEKRYLVSFNAGSDKQICLEIAGGGLAPVSSSIGVLNTHQLTLAMDREQIYKVLSFGVLPDRLNLPSYWNTLDLRMLIKQPQSSLASSFSELRPSLPMTQDEAEWHLLQDPITWSLVDGSRIEGYCLALNRLLKLQNSDPHFTTIVAPIFVRPTKDIGVYLCRYQIKDGAGVSGPSLTKRFIEIDPNKLSLNSGGE